MHSEENARVIFRDNHSKVFMLFFRRKFSRKPKGINFFLQNGKKLHFCSVLLMLLIIIPNENLIQIQITMVQSNSLHRPSTFLFLLVMRI